MFQPDEILRRARQSYQDCHTYSDEGRVSLKGLEIGAFRTLFRRADTFLDFSFRWNVGSQAGTSCRYVAVDGRLVEFDAPPALASLGSGQLSSTISMLTGVTFGAAHTIPRLLIPAIGGTELWPSEAAKLAIAKEKEAVVRFMFGAASLDIDLVTFNVVRHALGEQSVTVYRAQMA